MNDLGDGAGTPAETATREPATAAKTPWLLLVAALIGIAIGAGAFAAAGGAKDEAPAAGAEQRSGQQVPAGADQLIGSTEEEASALAAERGWDLRVVEIDGEPQPITRDLREDRINVAVEGGKVTAIKGMY